MQFTARDLNRTLLARQHLLERTTTAVPVVVEHLSGLQAQANLPPYFALAARLEGFDPHTVSRGLRGKSLVRLNTMRGTVHLLVADDALSLRQWTQPCQSRERAASANTRDALHLDPVIFREAVSEVLDAGPLSGKELGLRLEEHFPSVPPTALTNLARVDLPLAQLPPRGCWKEPGGVVYQSVDRWLERPLGEPDPATVVRRYLRAFGPGTAADVTAWSGITRLGPVVAGMGDLVTHTGPSGQPVYDVEGAPTVSGDQPSPVRLLGTYDNVWLAHAARDRVCTAQNRKRWMGTNGGVANTVFVDGMLEGLWRIVDGELQFDLFRDLSEAERRELADEAERVRALLAM